jgi:hypothetical protein
VIRFGKSKPNITWSFSKSRYTDRTSQESSFWYLIHPGMISSNFQLILINGFSLFNLGVTYHAMWNFNLVTSPEFYNCVFNVLFAICHTWTPTLRTTSLSKVVCLNKSYDSLVGTSERFIYAKNNIKRVNLEWKGRKGSMVQVQCS